MLPSKQCPAQRSCPTGALTMYYSCYYYWEDELKGTPLSNFPLNLRRQRPFL